MNAPERRHPRRPPAAVAIAQAAVGHGTYQFGTGDYDTPRDGVSDCAGFAISACYGLRRHRPGFNLGAWASVSDDLNVNSAIEDADHHRELFVRAIAPEVGDLLGYPTFRLIAHPRPFIGHIAIVVGVVRMTEWDAMKPNWALLDVVQCYGPDGRHPAIAATTGGHWDDHDRAWPKPEHRSVLLRLAPRDGWR